MWLTEGFFKSFCSNLLIFKQILGVLISTYPLRIFSNLLLFKLIGGKDVYIDFAFYVILLFLIKFP